MPALEFQGKQLVQADHFKVPLQALDAVAKKSYLPKGQKPSFDGSLIIEGDNLKALKALVPMCSGRVNCVYIDPPYNTGNDGWVYNDNVNTHPLMAEWFQHKSPVESEDMQRHDKWLCMMWPRLQLLRELMADDGVIFISIDDNEQHRLRLIMDEIFGVENFVTNIIWQKKGSPQNDARYFSDNHDFILCYAKNKQRSGACGAAWTRQLLPRTTAHNKAYKYNDHDGRGPWASGDLSVKTYSAAYDYPIQNPSTGQLHHPPQGRCWRMPKKKIIHYIQEGRVFFGRDGKGVPMLKRYLKATQQGVVPLTVWPYNEVGSNSMATQEIKEIFPDHDLPFETPKPVDLIKRILQVATKKEALVLDSFAGSGTTAQAVLELNKEDGGNRKFILVQCEEQNKTTNKAVNIAHSITAERVRRVIKGVPGAKKNPRIQKGLGGSFTYCSLGEEISFGKMLSGKSLPSYDTVARMAAYTATGGRAPDKIKPTGPDGLFFETKDKLFYLIYRPELKFLQSSQSAFDEERMYRIHKQVIKKQKQAVVYASHKFVGQKYLSQHGIVFCGLPYAIV